MERGGARVATGKKGCRGLRALPSGPLTLRLSSLILPSILCQSVDLICRDCHAVDLE